MSLLRHAELLCVALLAGMAFFLATIRSQAAESPTRFATVTNWQATFTRSLQSSGTFTGPDQCVYNWSFSHSGSLSSEFIGFLFFGWSDIADTNKNFTFSIQDRGTQTCENSEPTTYQASSGNSMIVVQGMALHIDPAKTNYTLEGTYLLGPYEGTVNGDPFPGSAVSWFPPSTNAITEPLPDSGMVLSGTRHYALSSLDFFSLAPLLTIAASGSPLGFGANHLTGELVVTWTLQPAAEEVEVVVEPDDYDTWLPKGNLESPEKFGNHIIVRAHLQRPDGTPTISGASKFKFELLDVSKEPGVCMNFPLSSPSSANDLKFEQSLNNLFPLQPVRVVSETVAEVEDTAPAPPFSGIVAAATAVSCFDFGAYGTIKVTATVHGRDIVGYLKTDPQKRVGPIRLPKRKEDSHIADEWKKNVSQLADSDDEENDPVGDTHRGDGYSLYQEYRGFSENRNHRRIDPRKKDLFIFDGIADGPAKQQILLFARVSGLKVRHELRDDEIPASNLMNINHDSHHLHDQAGLRIVRGSSYQGYSEAAVRQGYHENGTPGAHTQIRIDPTPGLGLDLTGGNEVFLGAPSYISIAHELAHGCSVWHHGDHDPRHKNWRSFIEVGLGVLSTLDGVSVFVHEENGLPMNRPISNPKAYVAVLQGEHSGNQDCIMRYMAARLYSHKTMATRTNEFTGDVVTHFVFYNNGREPNANSHLCANGAGTGINAARANTVWPRHGDADPKRGNCKAQVCVNDKYIRDSLHERD